MKRYEKYKDSKVAWLGQIPEHWKELFLFQCAEESKASNKGLVNQNLLSLSYGNIIRKRIDATTGLVPASFETYQIVDEGNIVMRLTDLQNDKRSLRTGLVKEKGIITSAYVCLKCKSSVLPKYFHYLLHSFDISKLFYSLGGGLRQGCNYSDLKKVVITIPPPAEQEQIVRYLDWKVAMADKFVRDKKREIALLRELCQSEINQAVTSGLDPHATTKPSGIDWIGDIPKHWKAVLWGQCFSEIIEKNKDGSFSKASSFRYGEIEQKNEIGTDEELNNTYNNYTILKVGDIVINGLNLNYDFVTQRVAITNYDTIITSAYISIRCKKSVAPQYACYLLKSFDNKKVFNGMGKGIRLTLSFTELKKQYLFIPPIKEQQQIVEHIKSIEVNINKAIEKVEKEIALTAEYKTRLISDVTTGKVDVRGIEIPDYTIEEELTISDNEEIDE